MVVTEILSEQDKSTLWSGTQLFGSVVMEDVPAFHWEKHESSKFD